jgi:hypothetical protein
MATPCHMPMVTSEGTGAGPVWVLMVEHEMDTSEGGNKGEGLPRSGGR